MRTASKRLGRTLSVLAIVALLGTQAVSASPNDDRNIGRRDGVIHRLTHLVTHILDELGWPRP